MHRGHRQKSRFVGYGTVIEELMDLSMASFQFREEKLLSMEITLLTDKASLTITLALKALNACNRLLFGGQGRASTQC